MIEDPRRTAPAVERNRDPILAVLRRELPPTGLVLEVASGSGEHCAHFATALPRLVFQPSDPDPINRASCDAWCAGLPNVRPALALDAAAEWPIAAAAAVLPPGGKLILYGPWLREGVPTAPSNLAFDADLRQRNPEWGLRRVEDLARAARDFEQPAVTEMPANNVTLVLKRR
jgi:hypothetical protein